MWAKITNDLFGIAKRIKHINPMYETFRNVVKHRYEVHSAPRPSARSLEFIVPFDHLDERTLEYARKTRVENADAIELEHTKANAELEASVRTRAAQSTAILGDMMDYAAGQVHEVVFKKNKRWF